MFVKSGNRYFNSDHIVTFNLSDHGNFQNLTIKLLGGIESNTTLDSEIQEFLSYFQ